MQANWCCDTSRSHLSPLHCWSFSFCQQHKNFIKCVQTMVCRFSSCLGFVSSCSLTMLQTKTKIKSFISTSSFLWWHIEKELVTAAVESGTQASIAWAQKATMMVIRLSGKELLCKLWSQHMLQHQPHHILAQQTDSQSCEILHTVASPQLLHMSVCCHDTCGQSKQSPTARTVTSHFLLYHDT
jgi:hypothetical protein